MGTMAACGVLRDEAPRVVGFMLKNKNHGEKLFVVKKAVILTMKRYRGARFGRKQA